MKKLYTMKNIILLFTLFLGISTSLAAQNNTPKTEKMREGYGNNSNRRDGNKKEHSRHNGNGIDYGVTITLGNGGHNNGHHNNGHQNGHHGNGHHNNGHHNNGHHNNGHQNNGHHNGHHNNGHNNGHHNNGHHNGHHNNGHHNGHHNNWTACNSNDFEAMVYQIESYNFDSDRRRAALQMIPTYHFSTSQVRVLLGLFDFESDRLKIAKAAFDFTCDRNNYYQLFNCFDFDSSRHSLENYMNSY